MVLNVKLSYLKHRVALCTMQDIVRSGDTMELRREAVQWAWAGIMNQQNLPNFMSRQGYTIKEPVDRPSHIITVRCHLELSYTSAAWVYEERLKSSPRWYKVLGTTEYDNWIDLVCHLVEKSDKVMPPTGDLAPVNLKVEL
jgi:hypothetical protein